MPLTPWAATLRQNPSGAAASAMATVATSWCGAQTRLAAGRCWRRLENAADTLACAGRRQSVRSAARRLTTITRNVPRSRPCGSSGCIGFQAAETPSAATSRPAARTRPRPARCARASTGTRSSRRTSGGRRRTAGAAPIVPGPCSASRVATPWSAAPTPTAATTSRVAERVSIGTLRGRTRSTSRPDRCLRLRRRTCGARAMGRTTPSRHAPCARTTGTASWDRVFSASIARISTCAWRASRACLSCTSLGMCSGSCSARTSAGLACDCRWAPACGSWPTSKRPWLC
mmetsp:Transcript_20671/g.61892  ORF Transcript_20671/g.61892 Transcript_20671/m.61892 type:complete len:288 (+) Transcript_20671:381-1244(+)